MFVRLDPKLKMSETDTHVFFLNGPFSQWYPSEFTAQIDTDTYTFNCAEQFMMAAKARLFKDEVVFEQIMDAKQDPSDWRNAPRQHKELGRKVSGFDPVVWDANAQVFVFDGNMAKFTQNEELGSFMKMTGSKILVEGAHYDRVWGVGLAWDDPAIIDPTNWRGKNWLGEALMRVRDRL